MVALVARRISCSSDSCFPRQDNFLTYASVDEDEIEDRTTALRKKLEAEDQAGNGKSNVTKADARGLKAHQVHDLAQAKIEETEKLRRALGIREDYEEGSHWRKGEERLREAVAEAKPATKENEPEKKPGKKPAADDDDDDYDRRRRSRRSESSDYDSDSDSRRSYSD